MKNRLYMSRSYLAGAMDRVPDGGIQWRDNLIPWLNSRGIIALNPCNKPCEIGCETPATRKIRHEAKLNGDPSKLLADRDVRAVDLRLVDTSDFLIINIDIESHPCGTYEELFLANREKKPILIRCEQGKWQAPDWLFWTIPHEMIFGTWDELKGYVDHIAFSDKVDRLKRWIFFDFSDITQAAIDGWDSTVSNCRIHRAFHAPDEERIPTDTIKCNCGLTLDQIPPL